MTKAQKAELSRTQELDPVDGAWLAYESTLPHIYTDDYTPPNRCGYSTMRKTAEMPAVE